MYPGLNYKEDDEKFILLGKVFETIDEKNSKEILSRIGFKNRDFGIICIKIFFMSLFFNYPLSIVIDELNNKEELRKFAGILEVPEETQVSGYFSRFDIVKYYKMINSYLKRYFKPHKKIKDEYIVDATPVACDINIVKKYISDDHLKKLGLKWSYSTTKKSFIGFKVTVVLEKNSLTPVSILIHPGAPHDSRIFEGILKELKRRRLIKPGDILYFDRGYYSIENYQIDITKFKIHPIIFPKFNFNIDDITEKLSYPLEIYANNNETENLKEEINDLANQTVEILREWKDYKPIRGIIEDFFKVAKNAFGLDEFHSYTEKSMVKNIILGLLLTTIVIQQGFKTKTQLQRLSEGYVDFEKPKTTKKSKKSDDKEKTEKTNEKKEKSGQQNLEVKIKEQKANLYNYEDYQNPKSEKTKENSLDKFENNEKSLKTTIKENLSKFLINPLKCYNTTGFIN